MPIELDEFWVALMKHYQVAVGSSSSQIIPYRWMSTPASRIRTGHRSVVAAVVGRTWRIELVGERRVSDENASRRKGKKDERDSTRNCNLLIANDNRSQTRYHCATHP